MLPWSRSVSHAYHQSLKFNHTSTYIHCVLQSYTSGVGTVRRRAAKGVVETRLDCVASYAHPDSIEGYCRVVKCKLSVRQPSATRGTFYPLADDVVAPHKVPDGLAISVAKSRPRSTVCARVVVYEIVGAPTRLARVLCKPHHRGGGGR